MALPERAASQTLPAAQVGLRTRGASMRDAFTAVQPLLAPFAAAWLTYVALGVLVHARALRVYDAGALPGSDFLRDAAFALAPDSLLTTARSSTGGAVVIAAYLVVACLAVASWCWAIRVARRLELRSLLALLVLTALLATCLLAFTGLFSDDVYLYHLYGRMIDTYGANPFLNSPSAFPYDPHLPWVHWKFLPAAYGPIWLMLSGVLSALSGEDITSAVIVYRGAALVLHLATAAALWLLLSRTAPRDAAAATIFYAWNPLVLVEVVANAHNDVLVALFAVLLVAAASARAWSSAAFFGACAVMVKPFAVLLLPPLALRIVDANPAGRRMPRMLAAVAAGGAVVVGTSLPLWAGMALLDNISANPASHMYTNTIWELLSEAGPVWFGASDTVSIQHPYLDVARYVCFAAGALWVLTRPWARQSVPRAALALWIVFCLTASWLWPWYFVPAIALAAAGRSRSGLAAATALTVGGLLFWATWPPPAPVGSLYTWRSLVLFGPLLLTWTWAPARAAILAALGANRAAPHQDGPAGVQLQTATG